MDPESLRLLLIEDNLIDARVIQEYLAHTNGLHIELERAERLSLGMTCLRNRQFDAALMDLNLPDSAGSRTVEQVHACQPNVPIVVLTGEDSDELALQVVQAGAEDYICKRDMEPKLMLRTIRYAIERAGRRTTGEKLRQSELRYRALFQESPDGVLLLDPVTSQPLDFNEAACRQLGYTREEFGHLRISDYETHETPENIQSHIEAILRDGRANFETQHRCKSGDLRNVLVTVQAIALAGQQLLHAIYRDITDYRRAEEALGEREQRYRELLEAVTNYTYSVKLETGEPVSTDHSWGCLSVTGYTPEDYKTDHYLWINMVHPNDRDMVRQYVAAILGGEQVPSIPGGLRVFATRETG